LLERVRNLSGDAAADDKYYEELKQSVFLWDSATIPTHVREHLVRDVGPKAFSEGGDILLRAPLARSLSRGSPVNTSSQTDPAKVIRLVTNKDN